MNMRILVSLLLLSTSVRVVAADPSFAVRVDVDAGGSGPELVPVWRFFGADEPNYATMKDGRALLGELGQLRSGDVWFRAHNLFTSGDGTPAFKWGSTNAYTEVAGSAVYDWRVIDQIFDAYLANGVRPYVELGFMPRALSSAPADVPYQHSWRPWVRGASLEGGWNYPPRDYQRWSDLCFEFTKHLVQRYGEKEVSGWWFETWNEANLPVYWKGTADDFLKLHDFAVAGVRRALPAARVGGPDVAGHGGPFMQAFLDHVTTGRNHATGAIGTPTDFLSFHAKGSPTFTEGHVRMGIREQLVTMDKAFGMIAAVPSLRGKPVVIGESDPEGCAACQGAQLAYRNGTMYSSYTAATLAREYELAARHGVNLQASLTWAFEFEDQPYFAGFRQLSSAGIDLPVLNVFRLFARLGGRRAASSSSSQVRLDDMLADGVRGAPDVGVIAARDAQQLAVLLWHYHDDDVPGPAAQVDLVVKRLPAKFAGRITQLRIDGEHANAYAAWQRMGSPAVIGTADYAALQTAARLDESVVPDVERLAGGKLRLSIALPRQGVALILFSAAR